MVPKYSGFMGPARDVYTVEITKYKVQKQWCGSLETPVSVEHNFVVQVPVPGDLYTYVYLIMEADKNS